MKTSASQFFFWWAIVLVSLSSAPGQQTGAQQIYRSSEGQGIRVSIELKRGGTIRRVSPQTTFLAGDRVKIHFSTNFDGYVYALNETPTGDTVLLFPTRETGTSNLVHSGRDYVIPATNGWFRFDEQPGSETIHMIGSRQPLPDIEKEQQIRTQNAQPSGRPTQPGNSQAGVMASQAASPAAQSPSLSQAGSPPVQNPPSPQSDQSPPATVQQQVGVVQNETGKTTGQIGNVKSQAQKAQSGMAGVQQQVGKVQSGISLTKTVTSMPQQLLGIFGVRKRDLTFEDDPGGGAAYVASPSKLSDQPVYFTVELVHQ